ncbi:MAG: hypothetical protein ACRDQ2_08765 [Gaiellales bacterium]
MPTTRGQVVSTSAQLVAALAQREARDILVAPGTYDWSTPFVDNAGHRLRAQTIGEAVFNAGLVIGGSSAARGAVVEGITFDIREQSKTLQGAAIHIWGSATGVSIFDVSISGHGVLASGVSARQPDGLIIRRLTATGFSDYGVHVDASDPSRVLSTPALLEDIHVSEIARPRARSSNGTAEACLWVGNTAVVRRVFVRSCAWTGVWTGTANRGSTFEDIDIDDTPVGLYLEHFTTGSVFDRLSIGPEVDVGVVCEWADPAWGGRPACVDAAIQNSTIDSCGIGVIMGPGTLRTTVRGVRFLNQRFAAVVYPDGLGNVLADNDEVGIAGTAVPRLASITARQLEESAACSRWSPGRLRRGS